MATTKTFDIGYKKFTGAQGDMLMSPAEFKEQFLYGIPLCNNVTKQELNDSTIKQKLLSAQAIIEDELGVKLFRQTIVESKDFVREEFGAWGFLKTSWPILKACKLVGQLNEREIIEYPYQWLSIKRGNANDNTPFKELYIVPNGEATVTFTYLLTTYPTYFNFQGARILPNYWKITYVTGFERTPQELIEFVGLLTSLSLLPIIETMVGANGNNFGSASQSLSFDGLSQSTSKMNGGNIFQQRIKTYTEQVKDLRTRLKGAYVGIKFDVC